MDLNALRQEREKWMTWKNIRPLREALAALPQVDALLSLGDTVALQTKEDIDHAQIEAVARIMMPWRKGPFDLFGLFIDTEWQSFMKYNLLRPHFNLAGRRVADIGCNNGYYLFRMQEDRPASLVGFDPSALYKTQFDFINHFAKSDIRYELFGVEHLPYYEEKFDTIFCLGVLYHRSDPVAMLKQLFQGLDEEGEVYLDTFMIDGGRVIPGFNDAVIGMAVDETKEVTIPVDEAYGQHRDDLVFYINRTALPADTAVGQIFLQNSAQFRVVAVNETTVTLDANSPLAGQDLKFTIKLLAIEKHQ